MKKAISCLLVLVIVLTIFTACGEGKPTNISDDHYEFGCKVVDIIDQYMDNTIDADTAYTRIGNLIRTDKDKLPETEFGDPTHAAGSTVELYTVLVWNELSSIDYGTGSQQELKDYRNKIADAVGRKSR